MSQPVPSVNIPGPPAGEPPDGRRSRWSGHREQRRAQFVEAAIAAVRRYGGDVGMDQIAAEAGVSKPVLYRYFADKSALWLAVGLRLAGRVVAAVEPAIAEIREERELVATAVRTYLVAIEAEPELYRFLLHRADIPEMHAVLSRSAETVASGLARVIGDRLRALGLDAGPALPWAHGLVGCVQAVGDWWLRNRQPISREALTEYLTTLLWSGLSGVRAAADLPGGLAGMLTTGK
jgi:AcrR family transcriptional regulator